MFKNTKVVMLPTHKASHITMSLITGIIYYRSLLIKDQHQHLYFISDEKVKEQEFYLVELFKITGESTGLHLEQCKLISDEVWVNSANMSALDTRHINNCKKIIASTDKSLGLPMPSDSFIKNYCELGGVDEVMVEYEHMDSDFKTEENNYQLKISLDNTVFTKLIKKNWGIEELPNLKDIAERMKRCRKILQSSDYGHWNILDTTELDKWIEENL